LRAYPGFTFTIAPGSPILGTSSRKITFIVPSFYLWELEAVNGISAMFRARLMAKQTRRWCFAQFPEIRLGTIFPRSVMKYRIA
jgi:hypothetical protein